MTQGDFFFDFVSPFSYFAVLNLPPLEQRLALRYRPILFGAVLAHLGQRAPVEIPAKREWLYRSCTWLAGQRGIPFRMPAVHPFNSVPYLRLALATDRDPRAVRTIFEALWTTGVDPRDPQVLESLLRTLEVDAGQLQEPAIKDALRGETDAAIAAGVFGVPTLRIADKLFWGDDALPMVAAFLDDPGLFDSAEQQRLADLPSGL